MNTPLPKPSGLHEMAHAKLVHVLGEPRADRTMDEVLVEVGLYRVETAEDLHRFGQALHARGSFVGALGGLLTVHALLLGARGKHDS